MYMLSRGFVHLLEPTDGDDLAEQRTFVAVEAVVHSHHLPASDVDDQHRKARVSEERKGGGGMGPNGCVGEPCVREVTNHMVS